MWPEAVGETSLSPPTCANKTTCHRRWWQAGLGALSLDYGHFGNDRGVGGLPSSVLEYALGQMEVAQAVTPIDDRPTAPRPRGEPEIVREPPCGGRLTREEQAAPSLNPCT